MNVCRCLSQVLIFLSLFLLNISSACSVIDYAVCTCVIDQAVYTCVID
jgi:hypothetical protein